MAGVVPWVRRFTGTWGARYVEHADPELLVTRCRLWTLPAGFPGHGLSGTLSQSRWYQLVASDGQVLARGGPQQTPGGATAGMADGSVFFATGTIDTFVWRAMGTRQGHEVATLAN